MQDFFGASSNAQVVCEVDPADDAGGVDQELAGTRDIVAVDAGAFVQEIVTTNDFGIGIGKERVGVAGFVAKIGGVAGGIDADGQGSDASRLQLRKMFFDTP